LWFAIGRSDVIDMLPNPSPVNTSSEKRRSPCKSEKLFWFKITRSFE